MTPQTKKSSDRFRQLFVPLLTLLSATVSSGQTVEPVKELKKEDEAVVLTPFNVDGSKDSGYYAENTLAGSRLRTNIGDLAASITVVTKQQLEDTASLDINDVFRFEASTEGSGSYTPSVIDRSTMKDTNAGYTLGNDGTTTTNAQSNRVRGLGAPDAATNFYATSSRIPFDSYNTQSIEINRGPNSMLFGLGTPAGIVNQSTAQAAINKNTNTVVLRTDNNGTARGSLAINRTLIKDKLAIYVSMLYDKRQFERKPSYDLYRRQYGALTYRPFKKTVIRAFAENYVNNANRPNSITPRDFVTPWLQAGRPAYDMISRTITKLDTNQVYGPYAYSAASPGRDPLIPTGANGLTLTTSPAYVTGIQFESPTRPVQLIDNGEPFDYFLRSLQFYRPAFTNPATLSTLPTGPLLGWVANDPRYAIADRQWSGSNSLPQPTTTLNGLPATYAPWQFSGISNKAIYDWTKYNTLQSNFGETKARNYNIEIEQQLLENLFLSAGWFRQKIDSADNYTISQTSGVTMQIDTNTKLQNGKDNPYFGLPYITDSTPDTFKIPELNDNYRVMLAYDLDLTKNNNWTKWLGHHTILGMWSEQKTQRTVERWRLGFDSSNDVEARLRWLPNPTITPPNGWNLWNTLSLNRSYYMASPGDPQAQVSHSVGFFGNRGWDSPYNVTITVPDQATGVYHPVNVTLANHFSDAGSSKFKRDLKSYNFSLQSRLWSERIVTTLGWRHDKLELGRTSAGSYTDATGKLVAALTQPEMYHTGDGLADYKLIMNRWVPSQLSSYDTKTYGAAFKPFKGWDMIDRSAAQGNWLANFARGITLYTNRSNNWSPPSAFNTDYFGKELAIPTGTDKELAIGFSMLDNKLVARVGWFTTVNTADRNTNAGTLVGRLAYGDTTMMQNWANAVVRMRHGADPVNDKNWNSDTFLKLDTPALEKEVWDLIKLPVNYYAGVFPNGNQNSTAKGTELSLTYNPTRNWTMKLTGAKVTTVVDHVAPQYDEWLAVRKPVWLAATAPEIADFTDANGTSYSLKNFWAAYGYQSAIKLNDVNGNYNSELYFANNVQNLYGVAKALEGAVSSNQRKYSASFLTNYNFSQGKLKGWSLGGNLRWISKGAIGYYGKAGDAKLPQVINVVDITRPIYLDNGKFNLNLAVAYSRKVFSDKVGLKVQLNVDNVLEGGGLEPIAVNFDGSPWAYRIIDPRKFILTTTFTF